MLHDKNTNNFNRLSLGVPWHLSCCSISKNRGLNMGKHLDAGVLTERDLYEEIAKVAFDLYKKRGKGDGYDFDDWMKAEKIVMEEYKKQKRNEVDLMSAVAEKKVAGRAPKKQKKTK
jgi:hypothetical protein